MKINLNDSQIIAVERNNPGITLQDEIEILRIFFNSEEVIPEKNWDQKIRSAEKALSTHWQRDMSVFGSVKLIQSLALSNINGIAQIHQPTPRQLAKLNSTIFKFLWRPRRIEQLARSKVTAIKQMGGLGIPDLQIRCQAILASRLKRLLGKTLENISEPWQKDAIYQMGTRIRAFAPHLYRNTHPNADTPDAEYLSILNTISAQHEPIVNWNETSTKQLYFGMCPRPSEDDDLWVLHCSENPK